ncbi:MAG TPA: hypothetical protein VEO54_09585 [Thermoanaerobaculia bacterium]|nr:hypothetical protein [Thermoanaerobaculia bacterium]
MFVGSGEEEADFFERLDPEWLRFRDYLAQAAPVARGELEANNLDAQPAYYAFVNHIDAGPDDDWIVEFEVVGARWMDVVWAILADSEPGGRLNALFDGQPFAGVWENLGGEDRRLLFFNFVWFCLIAVDVDDKFLGRAPVGLFSCTFPAGDALREGLSESTWCRCDLAPADDEPGPFIGRLQMMGATYETDRTSVRGLVRETFSIVPLASEKGRIMQAGLHALHLPQVDPAVWDQVAGGAGGAAGGRGDAAMPDAGDDAVVPVDEDGARYPDPDAPLVPDIDDPPPEPPWQDGMVFRRALRGLAGRARKAGRRLRDLLGALVPMPQLATPEGFGFPLPAPEPSRYIGSPATHTGNIFTNRWHGLAGANNMVANPMIQNAAAQPFVGVLDVGQANCNMLVDRNGHVIAFYDFGYPSDLHGGGGFPAAEPATCFCHQPLIILSHWDYDHWSLSRRRIYAYNHEWLVPQQHIGTTTIAECLARILISNGRIYLWTACSSAVAGNPVTYATFPWGWVERQTGSNPLTQGRRNTTGLMAYVCVRDQKGGDAAPVALAPYNDAAAAPNLNQVGGGAAAPGVTPMVSAGGAAPAQWPGNINWGPVQAEAQNHAAVRAAARGAAQIAPVYAGLAAAAGVAGMLPRVAEVAAAIAAAAGVNHNHFANGQPNAGQSYRGAVAIVAAFQAVAGLGQVTSDANVNLWLGGAAPGAVAAAWGGIAVANTQAYARIIARASRTSVLLGETAVQRIHRIAVRLARELTTLLGPINALGAIGVDDPNPTAGAANAAALVTRRAAIAEALAALIRHAIGPGGPLMHRGRIPKVRAGQAPYSPHERFILLTGDGNFGYVGSQHAAPPPVVVGVVAAHHGSKQMDGEPLEAEQVPWAPLSDEADAARIAAAAAAIPLHLDVLVTFAAAALGGAAAFAAVGGGGAVAGATNWGTRAEELLAAMPALNIGHFIGTVRNCRRMAAAAAAAICADARCVGLGYAPAVRTLAGIVGAMAGFRWYEDAHPMSLGFAAAHASNAVETHFNAMAGVAGNHRNTGRTAGTNGVLAWVAGGAIWAQQIRAFAWELGNLAVYGSLNPNFVPFHLVNGLPQAHRVAATWNARPVNLDAFLLAMAPHIQPSAGYAALMAPFATAAANNPPASWRDFAALYGAVAGAAHADILNPATLQAAAETGITNQAPAAIAGQHGSGPIAYSYGILPNGHHCYPAQPGHYGHPHPLALTKYTARGWTRRLNTPNTTGSHQPSPAAWGPVALGWEDETLLALPPLAPHEGKLRPLPLSPHPAGMDAIQWTCVTCPAIPAQITWLIV